MDIFKNTAFNHPPLLSYIIFIKASNVQYNQSRILNYMLVLIAAYFIQCS
jgi:hypothetical protein